MTTHFRDEENKAQGSTDVPKGTLQLVAKTQQTWPGPEKEEKGDLRTGQIHWG